MRILKSIGAVVAGFVAASIVMMIVETLNGRVFYPGLAKSAEGVTDREAIRAIFASAPVGAFLVVIAGWALGSVAGGWLTARIGGRSPVTHGLVLGALLTLAGIANNLMLPPPPWFWVASLIVFLPCAWIGARQSGRG
jgi:hypothetical protein